FPGSSSSTKRFMKATRAPGVSPVKVSALRAVRNFAKLRSLCEQAAERASRRAADGPVTTAAAGAASRGALDSCASTDLPPLAASQKEAASTMSRAHLKWTSAFTLILCCGEDLCQVLGEGGARHHFVAPGGTSLRCEFGLDMGEETDHAR